MHPRFVGVLCIVLSTCCFGAMPIFARISYAGGVDLPTLLFLRFALAAALMSALMLARGWPWPRGRNLCLLVAMGMIGYAGQAYCYFAAVHYASAGLTALLLYLYPVIVTLGSAPLARRRLSRRRLLAVLAALAGTALAVGGSLAGSALGIVLGIGAALIYSIYILVGDRGHAFGRGGFRPDDARARTELAGVWRGLGGDRAIFDNTRDRRVFGRHADALRCRSMKSRSRLVVYDGWL